MQPEKSFFLVKVCLFGFLYLLRLAEMITTRSNFEGFHGICCDADSVSVNSRSDT